MMETIKQGFEPDFTEHKFTIEIKVYKNTNTFSVIREDKEYNVTFQEVIGALEIIKTRVIEDQRKNSLAKFKQHKKKLKKIK